MEVYSRDSMAGLLRQLLGILAKIRGGQFKPDLTRSGYLAGPPSSTHYSGSFSSSSPGGSDAELIDEAPAVEDDILKDIAYNVVTGYAHVVSGDALVCPKPMPLKVTFHTEPPPGARLCSRCF